MSSPELAERLLPGTGRNGSIQRAFAVLEVLATHEDGASVAVLSQQTGLPRSTVVRLLASLFDAGAVARPRADRKWVLGPTISRLTRMALPVPDLAERCEPVLRQLTDELRETSLVAVPIGPMSARIIREHEGPQLVGVRSTWAERTITDPASGFVRMLLAEMTPEVLHQAVTQVNLIAHTPATKATPQELLQEVERIQTEGHSFVIDELEVGLSGVAVPVRSAGVMFAMLSIYLPTARLTDEFFHRALDALHDAAKRLSP